MGQDPNLVSLSLWTPLQLSCQYSHEKVTKLLLEDKRTDIDLITDYQRGSATEISWNNIPKDLLNHSPDNKTGESPNKHLNCLKAIYKHK